MTSKGVAGPAQRVVLPALAATRPDGAGTVFGPVGAEQSMSSTAEWNRAARIERLQGRIATA